LSRILLINQGISCHIWHLDVHQHEVWSSLCFIICKTILFFFARMIIASIAQSLESIFGVVQDSFSTMLPCTYKHHLVMNPGSFTCIYKNFQKAYILIFFKFICLRSKNWSKKVNCNIDGKTHTTSLVINGTLNGYSWMINPTQV